MLSLKLLYHPDEQEFGSLHLDYSSISVLDFVPPKFHSIEQLYLNHNHLTSLSGISSFTNLKVLHFRFNNIQHFDQLNKISNPFFMESIAFTGNPLQFDRECNERNTRGIFRNLKEYNPSFSICQEKPHANRQKTYETPSKSGFDHSIFKQREIESVGSGGEKSYYLATKRVLKREIFNNESTKRESLLTRKQHSYQNNCDVEPFMSPEEEEEEHESLTARFKPEYHLDARPELTTSIIEQQKEYLVEAYYCRNIVEKCFEVLRNLKYEKSNKFCSDRLTLKAWISFKASVSMRRIERQYSDRRNHIISVLSTQF